MSEVEVEWFICLIVFGLLGICLLWAVQWLTIIGIGIWLSRRRHE